MSNSARCAMILLAAMLALSIAGCGDSPSLEAITLSPTTASSTVNGQDVQFSVLGTYTDGNTSTAIQGLTYATSDSNVVSITTTGLARCLAVTGGTPVTITASAPGFGGTISDTSPMTCN